MLQRFTFRFLTLPCLLGGLWLSGCATAPENASAPVDAAAPEALFADASFGPPSRPIDARRVFAISDEMREFLRARIPGGSLTVDAREKLIASLFAQGSLRLHYEASRTRNAAEAFDARAGNCLSLVILTGAFAKELDLEFTYQAVSTDELWSRAGDMYFLSGHVNVALGHRLSPMLMRMDRSMLKVVDFLPPEDASGMHTVPISEQTVLAMYMNNRAAESLIDGRLDDAYAFAREALRIEPRFMSTYNTLGVIYLRHADPRHAEAVLRYAAERLPNNPLVLGNLIQALADQGRGAEAAPLQLRLARLEPVPPFQWFNRGRQEMERGEFAAARVNFQKEVDRAPDYHEFHYWLALADFRLGDLSEARKHLALALENSTQRTDHDLYAAKLDRLAAAGIH